MKQLRRNILIIFSICITLSLNAQVTKTTNVTSGNLYTTLTAAELSTVTNLTLTGTIDARDFKTMRDNMPLLANLDLSGATITSFSGAEGTAYGINNYYDNTVPDFAFTDSGTYMGKTSLTTLLLPSSITAIGNNALYNCTGLTSFTIPSSVISIGNSAFYLCSGLITLAIPASVTTIGNNAFLKFAGLITVDESNPNFSALDGILFDKSKSNLIHFPTSKSGSYIIPSSVTSIGQYAFTYCSSLTSLTIPSSVKAINGYAFSGCIGLTSISIPSSVNSIGTAAFYGCDGLTSVYANASIPVDLSSSTYAFYLSNINSCKLYVPYGCASRYRSANQWSNFTNIVEAVSGFSVSSTSLILAATGGSNATINVTANVAWTASSNQSWLTLDPLTGSNNGTFKLTASENTGTSRIATVTISAAGAADQNIIVTQSEAGPPLNITPGGLETIFSVSELNSISNLRIAGSIDARDFKTMRDNMPMLSALDLSGVTIVAYSGTGGTAGSGIIDYPANTVPSNAFWNGTLGKGKIGLISAILPSSLAGIGDLAFLGCHGLTSIGIPPSVTSLGVQSISWCINLTSLNIPASVSSIGNNAFLWSSGLISVAPSNPNYSDLDGLLFDKIKNTLIHCPTSKTGDYTIPSSVSTILSYAFGSCNSLTSLTIPTSVKSIGSNAFSSCDGLVSIFANSSVPLNLNSSSEVFVDVNKSSCTLHVPYLSSGLYRVANQWKEFANIVEDTEGFSVSSTAVTLAAAGGSIDTIHVSANVAWTSISNQSWLIPDPVSGSNNGTLKLTAAENTGVNRFATVTIKAVGYNDQIIFITQAGKPLNITPGGLSSVLSASDLSTITNLTLTGGIDARDFKTMRDKMPLLAELDLSGALIYGYNGTEGTAGSELIYYPQSTIPDQAFFNAASSQGKISLVSIILPNTTTSVGVKAFRYCTGLANIVFPSSLQEIKDGAFFSCQSLNSIVLPVSLTEIGIQSFSWCTNLTSVHIPASLSYIMDYAFAGSTGMITVDANNPNYSDSDGILFDKTKSTLIQSPVSLTGNYIIPSSVLTVYDYAFYYCNKLTTIIIPSSVNAINKSAFDHCSGLTSIYSNSSVPVNLNASADVFNSVNKASARLYVPYGTSALYMAAVQWNDFVNIIEPNSGFSVGSTTAALAATEGSNTTVKVTANVDWTASSSQPWLTVVPVSGSNNGNLTLTAAKNSSGPRVAIVTLRSAGMDDQIITVTQAPGMPPLVLSQDWRNDPPAVSQSSTLIAANTERGYFKFMPRVSGLYTFSSSSYAEPVGEIYDNNGQLLIYGYDQNGLNFNFSYNLTAGQLYYFGLISLAGNSKEVAVSITGGELQSLWLSKASVSLASAEGSNAMIEIQAKTAWNAVSDQNWLTLGPASGTNNGTATLTASKNDGSSRVATVTFASAGSFDQTITVTQLRSDDPVHIAAGELSSVLTTVDLNSITKLTLTGTMDARDFKTIRDRMPLLAELDLSGTSVVAYTGTEGTTDANNRYYPPNTIPDHGLIFSRSGIQDYLTSVILPSSLTTIGSYAFGYRFLLKSINIPSSVTNIGPSAFYNCTGLTDVSLSASLISIGNNSFSDCTRLTSITIPSLVTSIGNGAFYNCAEMTSLKLALSLTSIGDWAFSSCSRIKSVDIPSSVTTIGDRAFVQDSCLFTVDANNPNYSSQDGVLFNKAKTILIQCPLSKAGTYQIPASVITIERNAFQGCKGIGPVTLPSSLLTIGDEAFGWCIGLPSVHIPLSVTSIGSWAFYNCTSMTSVNIPASVTSIGGYAFQNCLGLTSIYTSAVTPVDLNSSTSVFSNVNTASCILHVPSGTSGLYRAANQWKDFTNIVEMAEFKISATNATISSSGGTTSLNLTTGLSWTASSDQGWLSINQTSGTGNQTFTFTATANSSASARIATVTVSSADQSSQTIIITQQGNYPPVADAGPDQSVNEGVVATLNGSASIDADSDALTFQWTTPAGITLSSATAAKPTFTAPEVKADTVLTFSLVVNDGKANSGIDEVKITVKQVNKVPIANAGPDQIVNEGSLVTLDGSGSTDGDGDALTYLWTAPAGITLSSASAAKPTFTAPEVAADTDFALSMVVNDGKIDSTSDLVKITIKQVNKAPAANAGPDQTVNEGVLVTLDGSGSTDGDGDALTYLWTAPAGITLSSASAAKPTFTAPEVAADTDYNFSLVVNDGKANSTADEVKITVKQVNKVPVADAGLDQTINENTLVTLNGSGSTDGDGDVLTYLWTAPAGITLSSATVAKPTFTAPEVNADTDYTFSLVVNDGKLDSQADQVVIRVKNMLVIQNIVLNSGWNIFSSNVVPANLDLKTIFQTLIDAGKLKKVMDETGKTIENFGAFGGWKNNIGNLNPTKGYKVNVSEALTLSLEGVPIPLPADISMLAGWNIISYPCSTAQDAMVLIQPLIDSGQLKKVMDEAGKTIENFGAFGGWKNNIGNFLPGKGYKVNVTAACTLSVAAPLNKSAVIVAEVLASSHFSKVFSGNGTDHFNVHLVDLASSGLQAGDQIGIFDGNYCVGSATIGQDQLMTGSLSIPASFNDEVTGKVNGFTVGHPVTLQLYRENQTYPLTPAKVGGSDAFEKNGSLFLRVTASDLPAAKIGAGADQVKCYPNPFVDQLTIEIRLTEPKNLEVSIYDLNGKLVRSLFKGEAGTSETMVWDGTNGNGAKMGSGTYIVKANELVEKVALKLE